MTTATPPESPRGDDAQVNKTPWVDQALHELESRDSRRHLVACQSATGTRVVVDGREMISFSSNDYLGLAHHDRLVEAVGATTRRWGSGSGASRLVTGTLDLHEQLERRLAALKETEAALLFSSGYQANVGVLQGLADQGVIFSDALNHASIIDGCRLARADVVIYRHRDLEHLGQLMETHASPPRKLIVTDGMFSMDGDLAPLPGIVQLAQQHGAFVVVDDAHGTGVLGGGRGTPHYLGVADGVDLQVGTFGKALGSFGAFVACSAPVRELLIQRARSLVYSTAPPPPCVGATLAALDLLEAEPERLEALYLRTRALRDGLRSAGFEVSQDPSPIVPVILGSAAAALRWSDLLWQRGIWIRAIRPPTVPAGTSRLRITMSAAHEFDHIEALVEALSELRRQDGDEVAA